MKRSQVALLLLAGGIFLSGTVSEKIYAEPVTVIDSARIIGHRIPPDVIIPDVIRVLKGHMDWLAERGNRSLEFTGSYIQSKNNLVGYVTGTLRLGNGILNGEGRQYFNDRLYYKSPSAPTVPEFRIANNPFDPEATDRLGLSIDIATGKAKIILLSWGGGMAEMQLEYKNGIFYGFPQAGGMHAFVFKRVQGPA